MKRWVNCVLWASIMAGASAALGQEAAATPASVPAVDTGDTAWLLISTGLVLFMTPGLAFFYGGLVRRKNILSILMQCFMMMCLISIQWMVAGYSLAFGPDAGGLIGSLKWALLTGVGAAPNADYAATVPHSTFMMFQLMFAIITPGLIIGAFAERMRFAGFCVFSLLWATLVYDPVAHWLWGVGGFLRAMGALDFAGGTVVHVNAGMASLAAALVLGRRSGYPHKAWPPHNLPLAVLGAGILWFGWYGFNGGSALASGGLASAAIVNTHMAAAAAGLTWSAMDWVYNKHPTVLGMITGAVAGLAAVTQGAGFVTPLGAVAIGVGAGVISYLSVAFVKTRLGYDDTLDAFGVHGVGGIWGALATGLWATRSVNAAGADGLFYGNAGLFWIQAKATATTMVYSFAMSFVLLKITDAICGLRVPEQSERIGLDLTEHREAGYTMLE